jgi:hypothetical protein
MILTPLFKNPAVGNTVTVDLDVWIENFLREREDVPKTERPGITIGFLREQIIMIEAAINEPITAHYRRSSKGHIHVLLTFPHDITVFDAFLLRSCLWDDLTRHALDEGRFALWGNLNELNKCFDQKVGKGGQVFTTGPWISLDTGKENLTGDALDDLNGYLKWRNEHPLKIGKEPRKEQCLVKL